jgi:hypothetical protein
LLCRLGVHTNSEGIVGYQDIRPCHYIDTGALLGLKGHNFIAFGAMIRFLGNVGFEPNSVLLTEELPLSNGFVKLPEQGFWFMWLLVLTVRVLVFVDRVNWGIGNGSGIIACLGT